MIDRLHAYNGYLALTVAVVMISFDVRAADEARSIDDETKREVKSDND
jgi:hypothetical protein